MPPPTLLVGNVSVGQILQAALRDSRTHRRFLSPSASFVHFRKPRHEQTTEDGGQADR
ncbi:hypothetical protein HMPREF0321_0663 [Dermacoccus sp. Ellin185]|nr:hypothetical protein HMPREF0321_0663 [Dermacoccus sp. Ellin185]